MYVCTLSWLIWALSWPIWASSWPSDLQVGIFEHQVGTLERGVGLFEPQVGPFETPLAHLSPKLAFLSSHLAHLSPKLAHLSPELAHLSLKWAHWSFQLSNLSPKCHLISLSEKFLFVMVGDQLGTSNFLCVFLMANLNFWRGCKNIWQKIYYHFWIYARDSISQSVHRSVGPLLHISAKRLFNLHYWSCPHTHSWCCYVYNLVCLQISHSTNCLYICCVLPQLQLQYATKGRVSSLVLYDR